MNGPISETVQLVILSALLNAGVTWGVISTKLAWLRRDVENIEKRLNRWEELLKLK